MLHAAWDYLCRLNPIYFEWIQVDLSTRVATRSPLHPAMSYRESWIAKDLSFSVFSRLTPVLERTKSVFLHGWGDPFANPSFFTMARICKERRCTVCTATRGGLLDAAGWDRVVESGIDQVAFPIDALEDHTSRERTGIGLNETCEAIAMLQEAKRRADSAKPAIDVRYTLTRSRLDEVMLLPEFLQRVGVDSAIVATPSFVASEDLAEECLVPRRHEQLRWLLSHLDTLFFKGLEYGVVIRYFAISPGVKRRTCIENVTESIYVGADGRVSPCAMGALPLDDDVTHWYLGDKVAYRPLVFGSLDELQLEDIWHSDEYRRFRRPFYWNRLSSRCENCLNPFRVGG
ncbi:hypothetical protein DPQ33_06095 [Oceanidesulfovibrio indonesiensis]|uniref:4Fe4S-binding SPASM domain-containing protein n=1 Tax=Oceanidesulfovibrio indonesiensis TaxID=54767 RepID=A0A7M3MG69_9BACT|nr:SPASM domain-containing protein [Oceanidesulfovibrio indonesiensis]TVM18322.1 hypothetical protein DPQ33_06095 [Oceanidesulfovibrio indonesiensis]